MIWTEAEASDFVFVFEFKLHGTAEEALQQVDDQGYLIPYQASGKKRVLVGVEATKRRKTLGCGWRGPNVRHRLVRLDNFETAGQDDELVLTPILFLLAELI